MVRGSACVLPAAPARTPEHFDPPDAEESRPLQAGPCLGASWRASVPENRDAAKAAPTGEPGPRAAGSFRPAPDVISRQMGGGAVLIHLGSNRIYETNATGARIWELLAAGCQRDEVVRRLLEEYDVDETTLAAELEEIIGVLSAEGLLKRAGPAD